MEGVGIGSDEALRAPFVAFVQGEGKGSLWNLL